MDNIEVKEVPVFLIRPGGAVDDQDWLRLTRADTVEIVTLWFNPVTVREQ